MRLLVVSHTAHYRAGDRVAGWGPTLREIDHLSELFDEVVHVAPLHDGPAPASAVPYQSPRVRFVPVHPAGGRDIAAKVKILRHAPTYVATILREMRRSDVVHVRCPANISMMAALVLALVRRPRRRWIKYAGNWRPDAPEALSYTFQRWWLARPHHGAVVTVNGEWPDLPGHVLPFLNPCLTDEELADGRRSAGAKRLDGRVRLIFVGRVEPEKGAGRVLAIHERVRRAGVDATLDVVGDGPARAEFEVKASPGVTFHGWVPRPAIAPLYAAAHLVLLPTDSEGWPKVLSEAMAYGVVPVASQVSSIPGYLANFGLGRVHPPDDVDGFAASVVAYARSPERWAAESARALEVAERFTYRTYLKSVREMLALGARDR